MAPSGEKATLYTKLVWPLSVASVAREATLQRRTVLSPEEPDASVSPSGEKATLYAVPVWPLSVAWELA